MSIATPLSAKELVDEYFIENRTRVLEIGAFLDRVQRIDPGYAAADFRMRALGAALEVLSGGGREHVRQIQMLLSDPREDAMAALDRKSAQGAYEPRPQEE